VLNVIMQRLMRHDAPLCELTYLAYRIIHAREEHSNLFCRVSVMMKKRFDTWTVAAENASLEKAEKVLKRSSIYHKTFYDRNTCSGTVLGYYTIFQKGYYLFSLIY
jgi:hypothetical protein